MKYSDAVRTLHRAIGVGKDSYKGPYSKGPSSSQRQSIVAISDLHAPFTRLDLVSRIVREHRGADLCVVNGDLDDGYAISRFIKYERVPYQRSLAVSRAILQTLSAAFRRVVVVDGNHDGPRFERLIRTQLPLDAVEAIQEMTGGNLSPVRALISEFPNMTVGNGSRAWFHQEGDVVFTHAEKFSTVPGRTGDNVRRWLQDFQKKLKLKPFRVVVQAHTHQLAWLPVGADMLAVEGGCLARTLDYQLDAKIGGLPQRNGYVTLEMVKGKVDMPTVRCHWLE